jgi:uncharacterized protein YoxC
VNVKAVLTPGVRRVIYIIVAIAMAALVVFGVITEDQINQTVENIASVASLLAMLMALFHIQPTQ